MNNNDERDYQEEAVNAAELAGADEDGRPGPEFVPPQWIPPSEQHDVRALAAGVYVVAAAVGLAADPTLTFDELDDGERRAWEALVRRAQLGTWCVDCLAVLARPWQAVYMHYRTADGSAWRRMIPDLPELHRLRREVSDARDVTFSADGGYRLGMYASTVHTGEPVCSWHLATRAETM